MLNQYQRLYYNIVQGIQQNYYNIINFYRDIIEWAPVIWGDRDYDFNYTLRILRFKINRMKNEIDRNKRHLYYKRDVKNMTICITLLDRMIKNEYLHRQYCLDTIPNGWCQCKRNKRYVTTWSEFDSKGYSTMINTESETGALHLCMHNHTKESMLYKKDSELLFSILHKQHQRWWD